MKNRLFCFLTHTACYTFSRILFYSDFHSAKGQAFLTPVDVLHTLVRDSQGELGLVTHPSCTLEASCGSLLSVAVEVTSGEHSSSTTSGAVEPFVVAIKSCNISLLARARLALTWRVQVWCPYEVKCYFPPPPPPSSFSASAKS